MVTVNQKLIVGDFYFVGHFVDNITIDRIIDE
jgi:hypothetical protein